MPGPGTVSRPGGWETLFYIISQTPRFRRKVFLNAKCVFWFSLHLLSENVLILRRIQPDIINVQWYSCKVPVLFVRFLMELEFPRRIFKKKTTNIRFPENPSSGSQVPCGGTNTTNVTFCNFVNAPDNCLSAVISCKCSVLCGVCTLFPLG